VVREWDTGGASFTCLALAPAAKMLFAGTEGGGVRCYKWPLTGEFTELKAHCGPVARLRLSSDELMLFSAGDDGALCTFDVRSVAAPGPWPLPCMLAALSPGAAGQLGRGRSARVPPLYFLNLCHPNC
jgi:hypothetical protein